jgi:glutamyl endopeptidase
MPSNHSSLLAASLSATLALSTAYADTNARLEAVIGIDSRQAIDTPYAHPYNAIARITLDGKMFCTGFLISPDLLVTAGHCIHTWKTDPATQQPARWDVKTELLKVYPGFDGNTSAPLLGSCTVKEVDTLPAWRERGDKASDLGAMRLTCSTPNLTNHLRYAAPSDTFLASKPAVTLSGYHGDKQEDYRQWQSTGNITAASSQLLLYNNDAVAGSSGSPVWVMDNGTPVVVGIHTYEYVTNTEATNIGTRLTTEIVRMLDNAK